MKEGNPTGQKGRPTREHGREGGGLTGRRDIKAEHHAEKLKENRGNKRPELKREKKRGGRQIFKELDYSKKVGRGRDSQSAKEKSYRLKRSETKPKPQERDQKKNSKKKSEKGRFGGKSPVASGNKQRRKDHDLQNKVLKRGKE